MTRLVVTGDGWLDGPTGRIRAALGRSGIALSKREGDGATPAGEFILREVWYRPDRVPLPETGLPVRSITPEDGWSDDPADPAYNRPVRLPHPFGHERLWREDGLYDLIVPLGYNDDPPVTGLGSAIFLHCARPDWGPTGGCVAVARDALVGLLLCCGPETRLRVEAPSGGDSVSAT
jgi:L,D-peptidoglycan transpeptidase YkuD (ErfK/YbiS/YcfS/YnhG family)